MYEDCMNAERSTSVKGRDAVQGAIKLCHGAQLKVSTYSRAMTSNVAKCSDGTNGALDEQITGGGGGAVYLRIYRRTRPSGHGDN